MPAEPVKELLRCRRHVVLNYLGFREIVAAAPFLPDKLHGLSALGKSSTLRKHLCLEVVAESLPVMSLYASSQAFGQGLRDFSNSSVARTAKDIVTGLVSQMSWMDQRTKDKVKNKISASRLHTFHPRWISDKFKVFAQYENVPMVSEGEGLRSYANIRKSLFENNMKVEDIGERWLGTALDQRCSFDVRKSSIYAPLSFFNVLSPSHDNYLLNHIPGTVAKLSHCLVELLLEEGVGSGSDEDIYSTPAWSTYSKNKLDDIRRCFVDQYSAGRSKNAATPSSEDFLSVMAENGAITPTFKVFNEFIAKHQISKKSFETAYNMTWKQFFFVSYVSNLCDAEAANPGQERGTISNHDRVNMALKNSREFQAAFKCPSKRSMNPSRKCHLWSA